MASIVTSARQLLTSDAGSDSLGCLGLAQYDTHLLARPAWSFSADVRIAIGLPAVHLPLQLR